MFRYCVWLLVFLGADAGLSDNIEAVNAFTSLVVDTIEAVNALTSLVDALAKIHIGKEELMSAEEILEKHPLEFWNERVIAP